MTDLNGSGCKDGALGASALATLGGLIVAASWGFLLHNTPPARIFLGDVGSAFLGFSLAVIGGLAHPRLPLAGLLVVWPFVFDTTFTIVRRLHRGENIFVAHRSHLYQRLVIAGYSHRAVTLLYVGLALVGVVLALAWVLKLPGSDWLALGLPGLLCLGLWRLVVRAETKSHSVRRATPLCADDRLLDAAKAEGLMVNNPNRMK